jgi:hypothetical protein
VYKDIVMENKTFETFYRVQRVIFPMVMEVVRNGVV